GTHANKPARRGAANGLRTRTAGGAAPPWLRRRRGFGGECMSFLDLFSLLLLVGVVAPLVAVVLSLGLLPAQIARQRGHPWAEAVAVGSWATLIFGVVLWPLVLMWAYVDLPAKPAAPPPGAAP